MKAIVLLLAERAEDPLAHRLNQQHATAAPVSELAAEEIAAAVKAAIWLPDDWLTNPMVRVSQGAGLMEYLAGAAGEAKAKHKGKAKR